MPDHSTRLLGASLLALCALAACKGEKPAPRLVDGKPYYQLSFVEDRKQSVHRRASFLVARQGDDILVEDADTDAVQSLAEWRRNIRNVELKGH